MKLKATILFFLLLSSLIPITLVESDPGWLAGWDYRVKISIDADDVDAPLTDFPILIYLSDPSGINAEDLTFIFDEIGANSLKIAITLSDGQTQCYVEVEKWDLGNEKAWLWVKVASISNITDTDLYLYFDNNHADNVAYVGPTNSVPAEIVWDNDYSAVQHLADGVDNANTYDSTENDVDGSKWAGDEPLEDSNGQIGNCQDYDGNDDQITLHDSPFDYTTAFTFEFWMKSTDATVDGRIIFKNLAAPNRAYFIRLNGGRIEMFASSDGTNFQYDASGSNNYNNGNWIHVGIVYDAGIIYWYRNGVPDGTDTTYNTLKTNTQALLLIRTLNSIDADIDEFRASDIVRTANYFKVTYEAGIDHLLDFGEEETPPLEAPDKLFGAGFNASSPFVNLRWVSNLTDISFFEVQNSTDKITWEYLGQNTTMEYNDFQVVNGTEKYYRVRACNFTGAAWKNSTWTDIDFETVYYVNGSGAGPGPSPSLFPGLAIGIAILIIAGAYLGTRR